MDYIASFIVFGVVFALVDAIWLKAAFYLLYILGATFLVVMPAVVSGEWWRSTAMGLLFGMVTYATYDLTNLSTLKGWSKKISGIDIAWGALLTAISSTATYIVVVWL